MINQFLKMAGVNSQAEFYKKYPTEQAFFKAHPQAKKMAEGGDPYAQGGDEQTQLLQGVAQMLQQGAQPEQVMQQLVQMGMPQDQAAQVIQMVMQQMQGAQQQPAMRYGGIPRAAMGMSAPAFGTGMIETLPNVENYPSYNAYKQAYNEYLSNIDTTTTENPGDINWDMYADEKVYGDPAVDTFAQRLRSDLIGQNDTLETVTPDASNNAVKNTRPKEVLQKEIDDEMAEKTGSSGGNMWLGAGAGIAGLLAARYALYPAGKKIYKFGQKRLGEVPEIDQSTLTPEQIAMNERRISNHKLKIDNRGYTVGKADVNELVSLGMSRADAQAYVDALPTKSGKSKKPATPGTSTTPANGAAPTTTSGIDIAQIAKDAKERFKNSSIEDIMEYDYHTQQHLADPDYDYHKERLTKDPRSILEEQIKIEQSWVDDTNRTPEEHARDLRDLERAKAKLARYNELDPEGKYKVPGLPAKPAASSTPAQTATQQTKEKIQTKRNTPATGKSQAAIASEKEANKIISEMIRTGKRTAAQMDRLNTLGMDNVSVLRQLKGKKVVAVNPVEYASRNKYIVSGMEKAANIAKIVEEIKAARAAGKVAELGELSEALRILKEVPKKFGGEYAMGGYVPEYAAQAYGAYNLPQYEMGSFYEDGGAWNGTWNGNQGFAYGGSNPFEEPTGLRKFVYANGGMSPEQAMMMQQQQGAAPQEEGGGEDPQMQQIIEVVVNMLEQGMQPQEIMQKLIEAGLPQEMAQQVIQHVMEDQQGGGQEQQMPPQGMQEEMMEGAQGQEAPQQETMEGQPPMQMYGGFAYGGTPMFDGGGEPCTDGKGNIVPCDEQKLKSLGADAYTRMQPFYNTVFEAAHKYENPETGMVSPFNSFRAAAKGFIKHPEVLFMKRHQIKDETADPYHVGQYTVDQRGGREHTWWPNEWAEPKKERNTGGGWWQRMKMKHEENKAERQGRRHRGSTNCWGANCYENNMQMSAYGGEHRIGDEIEVTPAQLEELRRKGIKFEIIK